MLRHSAFFMFREDTTLEQGVEMLKGLAYMRFACPSVRALDFGLDEFGGSSSLREVKPWKRQPRWRSRKLGPAVSYDVALHLDFDDQAGMDDYNDDDVHHEVAVYNASICRGEETARVDWWYDGAPLITKNQVQALRDVPLGRRVRRAVSRRRHSTPSSRSRRRPRSNR